MESQNSYKLQSTGTAIALSSQESKTAEAGLAAGEYVPRKSGCQDGAGLFDRIILWILITAGIESSLYYMEWWFEPQHRRNVLLFAVLSFAIVWGVLRSVINWSYFLFIKGTPSVPPLENASVDVFTTAMPGEPFDMFEKTLTAIAKIRYPHQSYLLRWR